MDLREEKARAQKKMHPDNKLRDMINSKPTHKSYMELQSFEKQQKGKSEETKKSGIKKEVKLSKDTQKR